MPFLFPWTKISRFAGANLSHLLIDFTVKFSKRDAHGFWYFWKSVEVKTRTYTVLIGSMKVPQFQKYQKVDRVQTVVCKNSSCLVHRKIKSIVLSFARVPLYRGRIDRINAMG